MSTVTVTFTKEDFHEVVNLLQLMTVLNVQLYVDGPQPDVAKLKSAFRTMTTAAFGAAGIKEPMHAEQTIVDQAYKTLRGNPSGVFDPGQASARDLARMVLQNLHRYDPEIHSPTWTDRPAENTP